SGPIPNVGSWSSLRVSPAPQCLGGLWLALDARAAWSTSDERVRRDIRAGRAYPGGAHGLFRGASVTRRDAARSPSRGRYGRGLSALRQPAPSLVARSTV